MRAYALQLLCGVAQRRHSPSTEEPVLAWRSFFGPGRTFAVPFANLAEACLLLVVDTRSRSEAVVTASRGLAKEGDAKLAITKHQLK